jgi:hypothetical protein
MRHWTFWEWAAYTALFIAAVITAADNGLKQAPTVMEQLPRLFDSAWWAFSPLALIFISTIILVGREFGYFGAHSNGTRQSVKWPDPYTPIQVVGKTFRNEKVMLDAHSYSNCEFYNVTFVYDGTTTIQFANNKVYGGVIFSSNNQAVLGALMMTVGFNVLKEDVQIFDLPPGNVVELGKRVNTP